MAQTIKISASTLGLQRNRRATLAKRVIWEIRQTGLIETNFYVLNPEDQKQVFFFYP